jgi:hypothetical protein
MMPQKILRQFKPSNIQLRFNLFFHNPSKGLDAFISVSFKK